MTRRTSGMGRSSCLSLPLLAAAEPRAGSLGEGRALCGGITKRSGGAQRGARISRPRSRSASGMLSAGIRRSTSSFGPQVRTISPASRHTRCTASAWATDLSCTPIIIPTPRTVTPPVWATSPRRARAWSPSRCARSHSPSASITSSVASAAAHETGLPPNVVPCVPVGQRSKTGRDAMIPASGRPDRDGLREQQHVGSSRRPPSRDGCRSAPSAAGPSSRRRPS